MGGRKNENSDRGAPSFFESSKNSSEPILSSSACSSIPPSLSFFRYGKRKREREENIMRRSDGQSFQPLSVHFPSLPPSLFFPFFPSFSTISGIVLETRLIVSSNFSPPCTLSPRMMIPLRNIREYCTTQANCPDRL